MNNLPPIILASRSPRRLHLLRQIGINCKVEPSSVDETFSKNKSPLQNAKEIALKKARSIGSKHKNGIVIGADTIVLLRNKVLTKPIDKIDAEQMLHTLSGREHLVITAFALYDCSSKKHVVHSETTRVKFRKLYPFEIHGYVNSGSPMDKAGAYGIQDDFGAVFVERVNGCYYNVVGLPLSSFYRTLISFLGSPKKR
jgi:septum formation protein